MLHELLIALYGVPGDIFTLPKDIHASLSDRSDITTSNAAQFVIPSDFDFVHPSERTVLLEISRLGVLFRKLVTFSEEHRHFYSSENLNHAAKSINGAAYERAFKAGMKEILDNYVTDILEAEQMILDSASGFASLNAAGFGSGGTNTPLSCLTAMLSKYMVLFERLDKMVQDLSTSKIHGTQFVSFLYQHCQTGHPHVQEAVETILRSVLAVFYKQLRTWLVYGEIDDPHKEFFIEKIVETSRSNDDDDSVSVARVTYHLVSELLPSIILPKLGSTILFVGRAVAALRRQSSSTQFTTQDVSLALSHIKFDITIIPTSMDIEISVLNIRKIVARELWNVLLVKENMVGIMQSFKDLYLLGNGEFWLEFISECEVVKRKVRERHATITEFDMTNIMRRVLRRISTHQSANDLMSRFYFAPTDPDQFVKYASTFVPHSLLPVLTFPLDVIFSSDDIQSYNQLLAFLYSIQSVRLRLDNLLVVQKQMSKTVQALSDRDDGKMQDTERRIWVMRNQMLHWINGVLGYVLTDVIETSHDTLVANLTAFTQTSPLSPTSPLPSDANGTPTLDIVIKWHTQYLTSILRGCFLDGKLYDVLGKHVREILTIVDGFCGRVENSMRKTMERVAVKGDTRSTQEEMDNLEKDYEAFLTKTQFLFKTFSSIQSSDPAAGYFTSDSGVSLGTNLSQLLVRLDFNRFLSCGSIGF